MAFFLGRLQPLSRGNSSGAANNAMPTCFPSRSPYCSRKARLLGAQFYAGLTGWTFDFDPVCGRRTLAPQVEGKGHQVIPSGGLVFLPLVRASDDEVNPDRSVFEFPEGVDSWPAQKQAQA
jgi:hypothetical protein